MHKNFRRILALLLVVITMAALIPTVSAATVSKAEHKSAKEGKNVTVFYVNAPNKKTTKISFTCGQAQFIKSDGGKKFSYGYYEVLIYGRNSTSESWSKVDKENIKNCAAGTLSMKGYTQYKVRVYSWNTATVGAKMGGKCNYAGACWDSFLRPTIKFTAKSNVKNLAVI